MPLTRKPRIAIMGEFSSGKSTLCNVLMGARPLLEKVTATQLPPVWLSYGPDDAYTMGLDGHAYDLDLAELELVSLDTTEHVRIFMKSDILRYCDLIDMPGICGALMRPRPGANRNPASGRPSPRRCGRTACFW
jgi:predicted GTPase